MPLRLEFPDGLLDHWACLGAVTDRAVRVWLRSPGVARVPVRLCVDERDGGAAAQAEATPDPAHDGVAFVDVSLASAAPRARFTVEVGEQRLPGRFAAAPDAPAAFTFGFASCHQPFAPAAGGRVEKHDRAGIYGPMRRILSDRAAEFLVLLGDQVYSDGVDGASVRDWSRARSEGAPPTVEEFVDAYRHLYRGYFNESGFRALLEAFPSVMTWDDHDIMNSWGSRLHTREDERRMFCAATRVYREYQWPHAARGSFDGDPPYAYDFWHGDAGFFVLDLRGIRSWKERVVLGCAQRDALEAFTQEATRRGTPTLFIVASIPLIHFSPHAVRVLQWVPGGHGSDIRDRWEADPFRAERDWTIALLGRWQQAAHGRQVIVLSGDVHAGAAFRVRDRVTGGVFHQWTSSSLSAPGGVAHAVANRVGTRLVNWGEARCVAVREGIEPRNNFGAVRVDPLPDGGHHIEFSLYRLDGDGTVHRRFTAGARPAPLA